MLVLLLSLGSWLFSTYWFYFRILAVLHLLFNHTFWILAVLYVLVLVDAVLPPVPPHAVLPLGSCLFSTCCSTFRIMAVLYVLFYCTFRILAVFYVLVLPLRSGLFSSLCVLFYL